MLHLRRRTGVRRHGKLHEQHAHQGNQCRNGTGWSRKIHCDMIQQSKRSDASKGPRIQGKLESSCDSLLFDWRYFCFGSIPVIPDQALRA
jgi:hypothetical protein